MKLGSYAYITMHSQLPEKTKRFCETLGFSVVASNNDATLFTDGNLYFNLRASDTTASMLSYCVNDIGNAAEMAENLEIDIVERSPHHVVLKEPNGLLILLIGPEAMTLEPFAKRPSSICGTFYEVSLETDSVDRSIEWWQNVGFKATARHETWCTMDDGKIMIGLYQKGTCPHRFKNPSLTYFEQDMKERIAQLQKKGMSFVQDESEIGMEGHAIAESPDGQYFFLFTA